MQRISSLIFSLLLGGGLLAGLPGVIESAHAQSESLRPDVGKPLQAAQELIKAQKFKEALNKIREAEAISGRTAYENFIIERMRGSAAAGAGDTEGALRSFETQLQSGRLSQVDQLRILEAIVGTYYRAKDYTKTITSGERYLKEGGGNPQIRGLITQSQYLNGDYAGAARALSSEFSADEKAGRAPAEERLQMLAGCYLKLNDNNGYASTLEKLLAYYPKKEYWADLLSKIQRKAGFSDRLVLDVNRLQLVTGNLKTSDQYMEMAQLSLRDELTAEAKKIVDQGFASGALGAGADVARQKRLLDLVNKRVQEVKDALPQKEADAIAAKDMNALVNIGFNYVGYGQNDKGLGLIEQAIRQGGLKRPEDAKLHLGIAYHLAGKKDKANQMFKTVTGTDGTADLARLWTRVR